MLDPSPDLPVDRETARLRQELEKTLAALAAKEADTRRQVAEAVERERRRLADALHQTASQSITAAYYLAVFLAQKPPASDPELAADIASLPGMIHRAIEELREIAHEFRDSPDEAPPAP